MLYDAPAERLHGIIWLCAHNSQAPADSIDFGAKSMA
jgi:hypothetical protein